MGKIKEFFKKAWGAIKENLPGVTKDYPYSAAALFFGGMIVLWVIQRIV